METDIVSIICTVKNGESTLPLTLDSIIAQSFNNWELIIVDDGSSDNTSTILKDFTRRDSRIKPIFTTGIGRGKALNTAIERAKGNLIANIDADDLMHPDRLIEQVSVFNEEPELFLLSTNFLIIYDNEQSDWTNANINNKETQEINNTILKKNVIGHSSVMMRKKDLLSLNMYNVKRKSQFDYDLWLRAHASGKKMKILSSKVTAKRIHENQSFENKKRLTYLLRSIRLQMYFILKSKKVHYLVIPMVRLIFGLLPFKIRQALQGNTKT